MTLASGVKVYMKIDIKCYIESYQYKVLYMVIGDSFISASALRHIGEQVVLGAMFGSRIATVCFAAFS